jgi:hypothetical protein
MKEYVKDEWGLRALKTDEMLTRGGLTFRELWNLLNILGEAVKQAEKVLAQIQKRLCCRMGGSIMINYIVKHCDLKTLTPQREDVPIIGGSGGWDYEIAEHLGRGAWLQYEKNVRMFEF